MPACDRTDVLVVGGGFSAVCTTLELLDRLPPASGLALVGPGCGTGGGIAYGTDEACHLLNVPAGRMSLTADEPDDFVAWLASARTGFGAADHVPRRLYRTYLRERLAAAVMRQDNRRTLSFHDATADRFEPAAAGRHRVRLSNGRRIEARVVVLCPGPGVARFPLPAERIAPAARAAVVAAPWSGWQERLSGDERVVIVGTGLTMVDQVLSLAARGHRGPVTALSRRGLVPHAHAAARAAPLDLSRLAADRPNLSAALRRLRTAAGGASDWRAAVDGLRPHAQALWDGFDETERRRFFRHLLPFWSVHRHRMAPEVAARHAALEAEGRVRRLAGRLVALDAAPGGVSVRIRPRGAAAPRAVVADRVVNCTGMDRCPTLGDMPLLGSLSDLGLAMADPLGLGLAVDRRSALIGRDGRAQNDLFAVGPITAGRFWEITAVPDIRVQAAAVATAAVQALG